MPSRQKSQTNFKCVRALGVMYYFPNLALHKTTYARVIGLLWLDS